MRGLSAASGARGYTGIDRLQERHPGRGARLGLPCRPPSLGCWAHLAQIDGQTHVPSRPTLPEALMGMKSDRQVDRRTDGQTDRPTDTDGQTGSQVGGHAEAVTLGALDQRAASHQLHIAAGLGSQPQRLGLVACVDGFGQLLGRLVCRHSSGSHRRLRYLACSTQPALACDMQRSDTAKPDTPTRADTLEATQRCRCLCPHPNRRGCVAYWNVLKLESLYSLLPRYGAFHPQIYI
jgi:hypothetical protein